MCRLELNAGFNAKVSSGFFLLAIYFFGSSSYVMADAYLDSLEAETAKIGAQEEVTPKDASRSSPSNEVESSPESGNAELPTDKEAVSSEEQRAEFIAILAEQYKGTFALYKGLPPRAQEEIFNAYMKNASFKKVSKMVVERTLNR